MAHNYNQANANIMLTTALNAGITSKAELANLMAQTDHESGGFGRNVKNLTENMNYSAGRMVDIFKTRNGLTPELAKTLSSQGQEAIANHVYGGEWGKKNLGNTEPGDGWKFRGRGFIQITGRESYERAGKALGLDLVNNPDLAAQPENAAKIAVWYWDTRVHGAAKEDVTLATRAINGGLNGINDRKQLLGEWQQTLTDQYLENAKTQAAAMPSMPQQPSQTTESRGNSQLLRTGSNSEEVRALQEQLNQLGIHDAKGRPLVADGDFGANTKAAVQAFQSQQGISADGVVGPDTMGRLQAALQQQQLDPQGKNPSQPTVNGAESTAKDHERILVSAIAGFDLGTGSKRTVSNDKVLNPNATYEYSQAGRDKGNHDGDKFKEVDCSGLVYHALKNAGYRVDEKYPNMNGNKAGNFTTYTLFNGEKLTDYAKQNFDQVAAKDAKPGDLIMFKKDGSGSQHIGIVAEVKDGKPVSYYGSQGSTGPAVTTRIPAGTLVGYLRPKDSFYDPSRDLTKTVPENFNKRYEQIKTQTITPGKNPGKPDYPLLNDKNSWANIKTNERDPAEKTGASLLPGVKEMADKIKAGFAAQFAQHGVPQKSADAMAATVACKCMQSGLNPANIVRIHVDTNQNKLVVIGDNNKFVSVDAIQASRQNPAEQYAQANQHVQEQTKQTQETEQLQRQTQQHAAPVLGR